MVWVRLDEAYANHPKVRAVGPLGSAMQVAALCYVNTYLTDGFIPYPVMKILIDTSSVGVWDPELDQYRETYPHEVAAELIAAGMWAEVPGGFQVHDIGDYQPSKEQVLREREQKAAAGRKGGQARAQASAQADAKQPLEQNASEGPSRTQAEFKPDPVPVTEPQEQNSPPEEGFGEKPPPAPASPAARPVSVDVQTVWDAWKQATGKARAKLDDKRRRTIQRALKAYPLPDVLDAVTGWQNDPWPERPKHVDVTQLLRDAAHIERFRDLARDGPPAARASPNGTPATAADRHAATRAQTSADLDAWAAQAAQAAQAEARGGDKPP